jgi:hypothetical protein
MTQSKPGPKRNEDSKRNSKEWVAFTCFVRPSVRNRVQDAVHQLKQCGIATPDDQSEIVNDALMSWLGTVEPLMAQVQLSQLQRAAEQSNGRFFTNTIA